MKLIIGLGNPGKEYENTRHNAGFLALDHIFSPSMEGEQGGVVWKFEKRFNASLAEIKIGAEKVLLAKPQTFMNNSGDAIAKLVRFYKIKPADVFLVHDDVDLPIGTLRIKVGGSSAGHKGVASVMASAKGAPFARFRIGIAPGARHKPAMDIVLGKFTANEKKKLAPVLERITDALTVAITEGTEKAMTLYNTKP